MRKIISINLFISILLLSLVFSLNSNLPIKFNVKNIVNYQHNYITNFNRLDFRHWGIPLFSNKNEANGEIIYNAIYLSSNQKKFRDLSLYKLVEKYQELNISEKNKINNFLANER